MSDEWIKVGSTFTVTLDTTPLVTLTAYSGHLVKYKRPDGKTGTLTPDSVSASSVVATITPTINPLTNSSGPEKWRQGFAGAWEFYAYCVGSGSITFNSKEDIVIVHPQWRTPQ